MAKNRGATVLVLEDDYGFRRFLIRTLRGAGYFATGAGRSLGALELLESNARFDLLIADIDMPSPQPHGIAVGNMGKMKQPGLKVIYITGNPSAIGENVVDRRETPLLGKPVPADTLLSTVKAVLARDAPA
jgi:DNA-binding NtrC family response regulator